ncbi:MAG: hypothetical protein OEV15_08570 [Gallionella sp.]|nr:hypothetical protein [Gallionella sp.]
MSIPKKIVLMVAGSLALLLALGFADPNTVKLMPSMFSHLSSRFLYLASFFSQNSPVDVAPKALPDEQGVSRAIVEFNRNLSRAYLELDPAALEAVSLDDGLRRNYSKEIAFLQRDGRALEMTVRNTSLKKVTVLPNAMLSVNTVESVRVRYLNAVNRTEIVSYPEARYAMNYTLDKDASGWKIMQVETLNVDKRDE